MRTFIALLLLLLPTSLFAADLYTTTPMKRRGPNDPAPVAPKALPSVLSSWSGGAHSLPYNTTMNWQQIISHAMTMRGVQIAQQEFLDRGYIRRADLDTAYSNVGQSVVSLGFEKPGRGIAEEQPVITVMTTAFFYGLDEWGTEQWWPVSTIGALVVRDSIAPDGIHAPALVADECAMVNVIPPADAAFPPGHSMQWAFSGTEMPGAMGTDYWINRMEQGQWWRGLLADVSWIVLDGGLAGGVGSVIARGGVGFLPGLGAGAAVGAIHATIQYVRTHPYPSRER
jgi:hypothetical protein